MNKYLLIISLILLFTIQIHAETKLYNLDNNENNKYWDINSDDDVSFTKEAITEFDNNGIRVNYNFGQGNWIDLSHDCSSLNLKNIEAIRFLVKITGATNNLEIKIEDNNGTTYGALIENITGVTSWNALMIPITDFKYWWGNNNKFNELKKIHIALSKSRGGKGSLTIANIEVKAEKEERMDVLRKKITEGNKVILDDFKMPNPYNRYFVILDEDSTLTLESILASEVTGYGMEYDYILSTANIFGTWVSAQLRPSKPLNWEKVEGLSLWVKGDNSQNNFVIALVDGNDEIWVYEDHDILKSSDWQQIIAKISDFKLAKWSSGNHTVLDKKSIKSIGLMVADNLPGTFSGTIYFSELATFGPDLEKSAGAILSTDELASIKKAFSASGIMKGFFHSLDGVTDFDQELWLQLNTELDKMYLTSEIHFINQNFGNGGNGLTTQAQTLDSVDLQIKLTPLYTPLIEKFVFGSVRFDQSPIIFSLLNQYSASYLNEGSDIGWGFKGVELDGKISDYPYTTYLLFHQNNSYTLYDEISKNSQIGNFKLADTYIRYKNNTADGIQLDFYDNTYLAEGNLKFLDIFTIGGKYGADEYLTSQTNSSTMTYSSLYNLNFSMLLDFSWLLKFEYEFYDVDADFKPFYRQMWNWKWYWTDDEYFDEYLSDMLLNRVHITLALHRLNFSILLDNLTRKSDSDYYKHYSAFNISYQLGKLNLDFIFENESNYYYYIYPESSKYLLTLTGDNYLPIIEHNEKYRSYEFDISSRLTPDFYFITGFRIADYTLMGLNNRFGLNPDYYNNFEEMGFMMNVEYLFSKNVKFRFETKHLKLAAPIIYFANVGYNNEYFLRTEINF